MSQAFPTTLTARLTRPQLSNVLRCATRAQQSPSTFVRGLISKLGDALTGTADPQKAIEAIAAALGLPPDSDPDDLSAAFTALLEEINSDPSADPGDEASAEMADPVPPKPGSPTPPAPPKRNPTAPAPSVTLSRYEIAECEKQGIDLADYVMRRDRAARRVSAEPVVDRPMKLSRETKALIKEKGWTEAEFREACATAVKRV